MKALVQRDRERERREAAALCMAVNRGAEPLVSGKTERINKYLRALERD